VSYLTDREPILVGLVGSHAHGLATEASDKDYSGIVQAPTATVLGLREIQETWVGKDPDCTYHELEKFLRLALAANPTILELLYLPTEHYIVRTELGNKIIECRDAFLSKQVLRTYGGYARSQLTRFFRHQEGETSPKRYKSIRHAARLFEAGKQLMSTGTMSVRVADPSWYHELEYARDDDLVTMWHQMDDDFRATPCELPEEPDYDRVNTLLLDARLTDLGYYELKLKVENSKDILRTVHRMHGLPSGGFTNPLFNS
jgi:uncharacterized protein